MIDSLPKTSELEGYHKDKIIEARKAYNALSDEAKAKVSNYEILTSLESVYDATYKMIYDMSTDVSKFSEHSSYQYEQVTLAATPEDSEYGKVLTANCTNNDSEYHVVLQYDNPDDLAEQLSGYDKVCFYIWNGRPSGASVKSIMHDFGGVSKTPDNRWSLQSQTWTKIELTVDEFVKSTYFGLYAVSNQGSYSFKFTSIWAEKAQ